MIPYAISPLADWETLLRHDLVDWETLRARISTDQRANGDGATHIDNLCLSSQVPQVPYSGSRETFEHSLSVQASGSSAVGDTLHLCSYCWYGAYDKESSDPEEPRLLAWLRWADYFLAEERGPFHKYGYLPLVGLQRLLVHVYEDDLRVARERSRPSLVEAAERRIQEVTMWRQPLLRRLLQRLTPDTQPMSWFRINDMPMLKSGRLPEWESSALALIGSASQVLTYDLGEHHNGMLIAAPQSIYADYSGWVKQYGTPSQEDEIVEIASVSFGYTPEVLINALTLEPLLGTSQCTLWVSEFLDTVQAAM